MFKKKISKSEKRIQDLKEIKKDIEDLKELNTAIGMITTNLIEDIRNEIKTRLIIRQLDCCIGLCQEIENYND